MIYEPNIVQFSSKNELSEKFAHEEVLRTNNIGLLAYQQLYLQLDKLKWLDVVGMKRRLENKMVAIT